MKAHPSELDSRIIEGYRRMGGARRLELSRQMTRTLLDLARARIRARRGDLPEKELRLRLASLWLDRETLVRHFDWDPKIEGY